jgi:hypothetical protein
MPLACRGTVLYFQSRGKGCQEAQWEVFEVWHAQLAIDNHHRRFYVELVDSVDALESLLSVVCWRRMMIPPLLEVAFGTSSPDRWATHLVKVRSDALSGSAENASR